MPAVPTAIRQDLVTRLHGQADAGRWQLAEGPFGEALSRSAGRAFGDRHPSADELETFFASLHLADLALACACADGHEGAWEHLMRTHRPALYRAADSLDPSGGAREAADALWADLFGVKHPAGERRSLLSSFHGRSSLATWLRAVLAQRHVDRLRVAARERPLPDEESPGIATDERPADLQRERFVALMADGLARAIAALPARDRLRLGCYYGQGLTLAEIARLTGEHEATVSRHLSRTRAAVRAAVETFLRDRAGFDQARIAECFASVAADAGSLDLGDILRATPGRKNATPARSIEEGTL